ncbi:MAG: class I SAM-dependent methyltransferase [Chthoniobacterales bacterium]|nr:class I SAM-dependent methyltransferase [Chthoniobacterales bacterium]
MIGFNCPRCGAQNSSRNLFSGINADFPRSPLLPIQRCLCCGIAYTGSHSAEVKDEDLYFDGYYGEATSERLSNRAAIGLFQKERQSLCLTVGMPSKVLDVGCGDGTFLRCLPSGVERFGYEPSVAGRSALAKIGVRQLDPNATGGEHEASFDLITLWQVFEHVDAPDDLLQKLRRLMSPDGSVFISVPNFGSLQARIFRGRWFHLDPARHLFHYERNTLAEVCGRNGFTATWHTTRSFEYGVFGWWQSFFNLLPFDFNMGYKVLKGRKKYPMTAANIVALSVYGLLAIPAGILSLALMLIEAAAGKGAVLQVCLRPDSAGKN